MGVLYQLSATIRNFSFAENNNLIKSIVFYAAILLIISGTVILFFSKYSDSAISKKIKESVTIKVLISLISGLIAWFLPWTSSKILFLIVALVTLFSIFAMKRKIGTFKAVLLGFLILFVVLVLVSLPLYSYSTNMITNIIEKNSVIFETSHESLLGSNYGKNKLFPDKEISTENFDKITINVNSGIELEFTDGDILHYPSRLTVDESGGEITISDPHPRVNNTYVIKMGTSKHKSVDIRCRGIKIHGNGDFKDFYLNCAGALINSEILSENSIRIDCAGLDINGSLEGKSLKIHSVGTDINGELFFSNIQINSTGTNIIVKSIFDSFDIKSTGLNGVIEVLNPQTQNAELLVQATGGALTIDSKNNALVEIESSGFVKIDRK